MTEGDEGMAKLNNLYDEDFVRWTEEQAAALRRPKVPTCRSIGRTLPRNRELGEVRPARTALADYPDPAALLEAQGSLAAERRAGWRSTIRGARSEIEGVLGGQSQFET